RVLGYGFAEETGYLNEPGRVAEQRRGQRHRKCLEFRLPCAYSLYPVPAAAFKQAHVLWVGGSEGPAAPLGPRSVDTNLPGANRKRKSLSAGTFRVQYRCMPQLARRAMRRWGLGARVENGHRPGSIRAQESHPCQRPWCTFRFACPQFSM